MLTADNTPIVLPSNQPTVWSPRGQAEPHLPSLDPRILGIAAARLRRGLVPPRCYYWWAGDDLIPTRIS